MTWRRVPLKTELDDHRAAMGVDIDRARQREERAWAQFRASLAGVDYEKMRALMWRYLRAAQERADIEAEAGKCGDEIRARDAYKNGHHARVPEGEDR